MKELELKAVYAEMDSTLDMASVFESLVASNCISAPNLNKQTNDMFNR